jgi:hypothetical protein
MVTFEGWIASQRVEDRRDTLDRIVRGTGTAPLRVADGPGQTVLAELEPGALLKRLSERNGWTRVRRTAWVRTASLRRETTPSRGAASPAPRTPPPRQETANSVVRSDDVPPPAGREAQRTTRPTSLRAAPGGAERASVAAGASVEALARSEGWVRVRIEGWVPERDLAAADSLAASAVSAADLRADPERYKGRTLRWEVQAVSVQRADPLRRGLAADEEYLLARGPGDEGAVVYVALPRPLVADIRALPPLTDIFITARVRDGRSPPVGAPLLDLISFSRVQ